MGHIIIISGPPGAGKSTVSRILSEKSPHDLTVYVHTDDFYNNIRKGYIAPWKPGAEKQNKMVSNIMVSCAKHYAEAGYEVVVDGLIGDWALNDWIDAVCDEIKIHYIIIFPSIETMFNRNKIRDTKLNDEDIHAMTGLYNAISGWKFFKSHSIDSSKQDPDETATVIRNMINTGCLLIN
ncbi:MAG: AAA family ATPase [Defluviitaleaceae bacterium]|nr:AAA family ATPase [Defluviitaleaceae bacterium]